MNRRRVLQAGTLLWVVAGSVVAVGSLANVNDDARPLVAVAAIVGPLLSIWAAARLSQHADRSAGVLLVVSAVVTPTYFAYVINLPALVIGAVLALGADRILPENGDGSAAALNV